MGCLTLFFAYGRLHYVYQKRFEVQFTSEWVCHSSKEPFPLNDGQPKRVILGVNMKFRRHL